MKFGDAKGFRKFHNFVVKCEGVLKEQLWNAINTPDILSMLVLNLCNGLIDRWNRTAYNIRKRQEFEPSLSDFIGFVDQETTLVNNPMFSRYRRVKSLAIETKVGDYPLYPARHGIEECDELKRLPVNERSKIFFKKKLL